MSGLDTDDAARVRVVPSGDLMVALRELAMTAHDAAAAGTDLQSWAVLGEMDRDETADPTFDLNAWVVEHDRIGRLAVRLDISRVICVGASRAVRGLHQGAVMEGSWGDEAILVSTVDEALAILGAQRGPDDVVLISGGAELGLDQLSDRIGG